MDGRGRREETEVRWQREVGGGCSERKRYFDISECSKGECGELEVGDLITRP